jgi:hypothetical protein
VDVSHERELVISTGTALKADPQRTVSCTGKSPVNEALH